MHAVAASEMSPTTRRRRIRVTRSMSDMARRLIQACCIAGLVSACSEGSPSVTGGSPAPSNGNPSGPGSDAPKNELTGILAFVSAREGAPHVYLSNPDGSAMRRLTTALPEEVTPVWSPDGRQLAFGSERSTYVIDRDGTNLIRLPLAGDWPSWSPDGRKLLLATAHGLRIVAADGSTGSEVAIDLGRDASGVFASGVDRAWGARWSPDGSRIAFSGWTDFDFERAFVMNVDGSGLGTFVGTVNNAVWHECGPVWSPDGTRIALLGGMFGGTAPPVGIFGVGIVDLETREVTTIAVTGTTCWDDSFSSWNSLSGVAWSPDQKSLAITKRTPSWNTDPGWRGRKQASITIVDISTKVERAVIPDAYDPAWSGAK